MSETINLQLNDIIQIIAPDTDYNENTFIINYIDSDIIKLINVEDMNKKDLELIKGTLTNKNIKEINLLSRDEYKGYAMQNKLIKNTWIDIHFSGDIPQIFTGIITDLEEDQIEIKTYPDQQYIYIDFGYKGLTLDIPIDKIVIREPPRASNNNDTEDIVPKDMFIESDEYDQSSPEIEVKFDKILLDANSIQFGEELEPIIQVIDIPEEERKYSIDEQCNDLLNSLLSEIPTIERTPKKINKINIIVERFKQLRNTFSEFDKYNNVINPIRKGFDHKPLLDNLYKLDKSLHWILPVAKNMKKVYDINIGEETDNVCPNNSVEFINDYKTIMKNAGQNSKTKERCIFPPIIQFKDNDDEKEHSDDDIDTMVLESHIQSPNLNHYINF